MRRRSVVLSAVSGVLTSTLAVRRSASAQDATPSAMAHHPIVGLWSGSATVGTTPGPRSITAFHGDGTLTSLNSFGGTGVGAWQASGERAVQLVLTFYNIAQVAGEFVEGTVTVRGVWTVDEAGTTLAEESTIDIRAADGTVVANFPITATFERMTADAPPLVGTPEATPTT